jgi:hypothetical protein
LINPFFHKLRLIQTRIGFERLPKGFAQAGLIKADSIFEGTLEANSILDKNIRKFVDDIVAIDDSLTLGRK